ncbi:MAG: WD40 repeat domain-containing serine/threonine protein kinase, partial [Verrucomicrobiales bacterium]|nr:WD40 repeat domain-containing serine/threonine protein kinase [Verrucomicrobiales bacterium]
MHFLRTADSRRPAGRLVHAACLLALGLNAVPESEPASHSNTVAGAAASEPALCRFGDYELLEELARGGMGVVYKARQVSLNRMVAVKRILAGRLATKEFVQRFRTEASAAASLQHPSIVAVHEVGAHQGEHFLAMELVEGPNLAQLVGHEPLEGRRAARYAKELAEAIHYAHERGILHRDLKPSNVLIDARDRPRITDFGLAKRLEKESDLTLTGQVLGSPGYMPPEQACATRGPMGRRSDVYSLGAVLYHLLTARPPFQARTPAETIQRVLNEEPLAPRLLSPGTPRDLETICLKCLEKDAANRYATAHALAEDLERFLHDRPILARPVGRWEKVWRWCRRNPLTAGFAAGIILLLAAVAVGSSAMAVRIDRERTRAQANLYAADLKLAQRALDDSDLNSARLLLDRHRPAAGEPDLRGFEWRYLWQLSRVDSKLAFTGPRPKAFLCFSTDGQYLASRNKVWSMASREAVMELPPGSTVLAFAHDRMLSLHGYDFQQWSLDPWQPSALPGHELVRAIATSRDGRWLATGTETNLNLWRWNGQGWNLEKSTPLPFLDWYNSKHLAFSPDASLLATGTGTGDASQCDLAFWSVPSLARLPDLQNAPRNVSAMCFSPDGHLVTGAWNGAIGVWNVGARAEIPSRMMHKGVVVDMAFSPTDTNLLATLGSEPAIRLWDFARQEELAALRTDGLQTVALAFAPDGRTLATSDIEGKVKLWDARLRRPGNVLVSEAQPARPLAFTPDGLLLLTLNADGWLRAWNLESRQEESARRQHVDLSGSLTNDFGVQAPTLSPDGKTLAVGLENGQVRLIDLERREQRVFAAHSARVRNQQFAPDGKTLATVGEDRQVRLWELASLRQTAAFAMTGPLHDLTFNLPLAWSPDGQTLAVADWEYLYLWHASANTNAHRLRTDTTIYALHFAPDEKTLVTTHRSHVFNL